MIPFLLQTLTFATPVLLAALGAVFAERAGVVNIGLEGLLLVGALVAVLVSAATGQPYLGVLAAALAALALAGVFAVFAIALKRDQVIVGTTINFLALGATGVFYRSLKISGEVKTLPVLFGDGSTAINAITLLGLLLIPVAQWLLYRTRLGIIVRSAGEKPEAVAAAGVFVNRMRVLTVLATGALCGIGGAALSIGIANTFTEEMTGGRGFIALAVIVFGRWNPLGVLTAALLFAAADVWQTRLQAQGTLHIPYPIFLALPYVLTLLALAIRGAKVKPPAHLGEPFEQG
ncbi:ABC transporter permease [Armatimonas sp.]|uniref:ABC transporter permease n=1 Tax=Armatimonas sp. TaxID=1872638 RepID=UPI00286C59E8|nr:ABC transporter permease [Armatimonas sp.]